LSTGAKGKVKAAKGKPGKGPAKTTVNTAPPLEITPNKPELVVVLDKTGVVPAAYPNLVFELKGPPNWLYDVQVARHDANTLTAGPGLTGAWDKSKAPKARLPQRTFSSWTNGENSLKFNGSGKATYTMPLDWWKDLARLPRKDFTSEDFYYRLLAFPDAAASSIRYTTPNGAAPPSLKIHNNLTDFKTVDLGYTNGGVNQSTRVEFTVREANTTDMYTVVQWLTGTNRVWGGGKTYASLFHYGKSHLANVLGWMVDSSSTNPRPNFFGGSSGPSVSADGKTAFGVDPPGGPIGAGDTHDFFSLDFESRVHLNFEVPASVTINKQEGAPPVYDALIGVLADPQPFILDSKTWKARILQVKQADGTVAVSHPDAYGGPPASAPKDGCFIATAAYGSAMAPEVQFLREIRDNVLRQTNWGRNFFDDYWQYYYRISPAIADEMGRDPVLRQTIRWSIVEPWTYYMKLFDLTPRLGPGQHRCAGTHTPRLSCTVA
jgi:hypothetical protein